MPVKNAIPAVATPIASAPSPRRPRRHASARRRLRPEPPIDLERRSLLTTWMGLTVELSGGVLALVASHDTVYPIDSGVVQFAVFDNLLAYLKQGGTLMYDAGYGPAPMDGGVSQILTWGNDLVYLKGDGSLWYNAGYGSAPMDSGVDLVATWGNDLVYLKGDGSLWYNAGYGSLAMDSQISNFYVVGQDLVVMTTVGEMLLNTGTGLVPASRGEAWKIEEVLMDPAAFQAMVQTEQAAVQSAVVLLRAEVAAEPPPAPSPPSGGTQAQGSTALVAQLTAECQLDPASGEVLTIDAYDAGTINGAQEAAILAGIAAGGSGGSGGSSPIANTPGDLLGDAADVLIGHVVSALVADDNLGELLGASVGAFGGDLIASALNGFGPGTVPGALTDAAINAAIVSDLLPFTSAEGAGIAGLLSGGLGNLVGGLLNDAGNGTLTGASALNDLIDSAIAAGISGLDNFVFWNPPPPP